MAFEGMALFRHPNGTYYIVGSHLTGWTPNPLMLFRAAGPTLDDPQWVSMGNPTGEQPSFNSQPTYVVPYTPKQGKPCESCTFQVCCLFCAAQLLG